MITAMDDDNSMMAARSSPHCREDARLELARRYGDWFEIT
jgi:hypothetical protein